MVSGIPGKLKDETGYKPGRRPLGVSVLRSDHLTPQQDLGQPLGDHLVGAVRTGVWKEEQPATRRHYLGKYAAALELLEQHSASTRGAI